MQKLLKSLIIVILILFPRFNTVSASENKVVTIVNPIRISPYVKDIVGNLRAQYGVVRSNELPATWLLTYDVLKENDALKIITEFDSSQEIGLFMEVGNVLAEEAGVKYDENGSWQHAKNVFLTGYEQKERMLLIDTYFREFNNVFGYYPRSVGAWWIDSYSLRYMQDRYNIQANLGLADQFSTDGYRVWGTYWQGPYYPSLEHAGIPAKGNNKVDVVTIQWAVRDPLNGYYDSYYSTQDYKLTEKVLDISYFDKLLKTYTIKGSSDINQITVGLEGDLSPAAYEDEFRGQIELIKKYQLAETVDVLTMTELADRFRKMHPDGKIVSFIDRSDLLGEDKRIFWYQNTNYRAGLVYDNYAKK